MNADNPASFARSHRGQWSDRAFDPQRPRRALAVGKVPLVELVGLAVLAVCGFAFLHYARGSDDPWLQLLTNSVESAPAVPGTAGGAGSGEPLPLFVPANVRFAMGIVGLMAIAVSLWFWRRIAYVEDTPIVDVIGAHPGPCEIAGRVRTPHVERSWFTNTECAWFESKLYRQETRPGDNSRNWVEVWAHRGGGPHFGVEDDTGVITVDRRGATSQGGRTLLITRQDGFRIIETALPIDDTIWVAGPVQINEAGKLFVGASSQSIRYFGKGVFWIARSETSQLVRLHLAALASAVFGLALAVGSTLFVAVPSTHPEHLGLPSLVFQSDGLARTLGSFALGIACFVAAGSLVRLHNRLVRLKGQVAYAWATIETSIQRRHDLITSLVATTQVSAEHERGAHVDVVSARAGLPDVETVHTAVDRIEADADSRLIVARAEAHPVLGASIVFRGLFENLVTSEDRLAAGRKYYNEAVTLLADMALTVPGVFLKPIAVPGKLPPLLGGEDPAPVVAASRAA